MNITITTKCPCETYSRACCACVSTHCDECYDHSKFQQGKYCSNCGRPLTAELNRNYVPKSEVEALQGALKAEERHNELTMEIAKKALANAKAEAAREIIEMINDQIDNIRVRIPFGGRAQGKTLALEKIRLLETLKAEIVKKYTEDRE